MLRDLCISLGSMLPVRYVISVQIFRTHKHSHTRRTIYFPFYASETFFLCRIFGWIVIWCCCCSMPCAIPLTHAHAGSHRAVASSTEKMHIITTIHMRNSSQADCVRTMHSHAVSQGLVVLCAVHTSTCPEVIQNDVFAYNAILLSRPRSVGLCAFEDWTIIGFS